jgi:uncharacterized protein
MPASFLHGVETIEIDAGPRSISQVRTAIVGIVGTAPLHHVEAADRKVNEPILILNDRDARKYFGPDKSGYTIPDALDAMFDQGAGIAIVINVFDPVLHRTTVAGASRIFTTDTIQLQEGLSDVVVSSGATTFVLDTDYALDAATGEIARLASGAIASNATVTINYKYADPTLVTNGQVIGTVNVAGNRTGMQAWKDSYNLFGFYPKLLIAPVYGTMNSIATELNVLAGKMRAMSIVDAPIGTTFQQAITGRGPSGVINFNTSSDRVILCYPHLKVYDLATETETLEPFSQRLAGVICATDIERGYWWSPSNKEVKGIVGTERKLTAGVNDPDSEVNLLNEKGIVTLFNTFGSGLRTWGNRSAAFPTNTHPKNFINIRRTADVIAESIELACLQFVDYPINAALIDAITESVNAFFRTLISRGALIDGECYWDATRNEPVELAAGRVTFGYAFMPPPPAERITFESFVDINLLRNLGQSIADS